MMAASSLKTLRAPNTLKEPYDLHALPGYMIRRLHQIGEGVFAEHTKDMPNAITPVQFAALFTIGNNAGINQRQLAKSIAFDRSTAGSVVERLERDGLITREAQSEDKRHKALVITAKGKAIVKKILPVVRAANERLFDVFSAQEYETFVSLLSRLVEHNNQLSRSPLELPGEPD